jgi:RNA polymerase sigma-70 factor (ECF subfamily)
MRERRPSGDSVTSAAAPSEAEEWDDEAALVARAKTDRHAFAPLYARYLGPVLRFCERRLGDPAAAEDATSQVFVRAMVSLPACRDDRFGPWLFAIARNVVVDAFRRRRPGAPLAAADALPDPAPTPEELALTEEERRTTRALLAHLTPAQRRVVELRLAGLTGAEIAASLGMSASAVKVHQFRAVARLRARLDVEGAPTAATTDSMDDRRHGGRPRR